MTASAAGGRRARRLFGSQILRLPWVLPGFALGKAVDALSQVDAIWYIRGKLALMFEVEWTAMLGEPLLKRHARIPPDERIVLDMLADPQAYTRSLRRTHEAVLSGRPAHVGREVKVDLPRPRDRRDNRFQELELELERAIGSPSH